MELERGVETKWPSVVVVAANESMANMYVLYTVCII